MVDPGPDVLPPISPGFVYFAYPLPMIPFLVPGTIELAAETERLFAGGDCSAVLLQNHGLVTAGRTFEEAFNIAEEVEDAARAYLATGRAAREIPTEGIENIRGLRTRDHRGVSEK